MVDETTLTLDKVLGSYDPAPRDVHRNRVYGYPQACKSGQHCNRTLINHPLVRTADQSPDQPADQPADPSSAEFAPEMTSHGVCMPPQQPIVFIGPSIPHEFAKRTARQRGLSPADQAGQPR